MDSNGTKKEYKVYHSIFGIGTVRRVNYDKQFAEVAFYNDIHNDNKIRKIRLSFLEDISNDEFNRIKDNLEREEKRKNALPSFLHENTKNDSQNLKYVIYDKIEFAIGNYVYFKFAGQIDKIKVVGFKVNYVIGIYNNKEIMFKNRELGLTIFWDQRHLTDTGSSILYKDYRSFIERNTNVLLFDPNANLFMPEKSVELDELKTICDGYSNKNSDDFSNSFARIDIKTEMYYGVNKIDKLFYLNLYISKNPPVFGKYKKYVHFINWKFYAGLLSSSQYWTNRSHTYNFYNYEIEFYDTKNYVDWRAPICELFYKQDMKMLTLDYREKSNAQKYEFYNKEKLIDAPVCYEHKALLKREYSSDSIVDIFSVDGNYEVASNKSKILQAALKKNVENTSIHEIIESLQPNQYDIIKDDINKNIIVQGCAGSGKTMIIYHRLSFMSYHGLDEKVCKILTPNSLLNKTVSNLLDELNIKEIEVITYDDYLNKILEEYGISNHLTCDNKDNYSENLIPSIKNSSENFYKNLKNEIQVYYRNNNIVKQYYFTNKNFISKELSLINSYTDKVISDYHKLEELDKNFLLLFNQKSILCGYFEKYFNDNILKFSSDFSNEIYENIKSKYALISNKKNDELLSLDSWIVDVKKQIFNDIDIERKDLINKLDIVGLLKKEFIRNNKYDEKEFVYSIEQAISYHKKRFKLFAKASSETKEVANFIKKYEEANSNDEIEVLSLLINLYELQKVNIQDIKQTISKIDKVGYSNSKELTQRINNLIKVYNSFGTMIKADLGFDDYKRTCVDSFGKLKNIDKEMVEDIYTDGFDFDSFKSLEQKIKDKITLIKGVFDILRNYSYSCFESFVCNTPENSEYHSCLINKLVMLYYYYGERENKDKYIFVDEAQDFNLNLFKTIDLINGGVIFDIFGDINQRINPNGISGWFELEYYKKMDKLEILDNYRNPRNICNYCNKEFEYNMNGISDVLGEVHELDFENIIKEINKVDLKRTVIIGSSDSSRLNSILKNIKRNYIFSNVENGKISVLTPLEAKGLEFNNVFVICDKLSANELYVAFTRSLENLYILK